MKTPEEEAEVEGLRTMLEAERAAAAKAKADLATTRDLYQAERARRLAAEKRANDLDAEVRVLRRRHQTLRGLMDRMMGTLALGE